MSKQSGPPPQLNGRYRLVAWLAEDAMGTLYRAHDDALERDVVIKFLKPELITDSEASARFFREARAVAQLTHPNIVALYDVGEQSDWHYMVLEHIVGQSLYDVLHAQAGPLAYQEALNAVGGILEALAYAHEQGIVHRDIKPGNVMRTETGHIKVTDFGLSLARGNSRLTERNIVVGTVAYLSPEVIQGAPPDVRSDLYAVGTLFYELLTGRLPFMGDSEALTMAQILHIPPPHPRVHNPNIPPKLERVILQLLAKEPAARYPSARVVLGDLSTALAVGEPLPREVAKDEVPLAERTLLERIVRNTSAQIVRPSTKEAAPAGGQDTNSTRRIAKWTDIASPVTTDALILYAALDDTIAAVEAERYRLAHFLQRDVLGLLDLLLTQTRTYEQTMGDHTTARMAFSVLSALGRQVQEQVQDMATNLRPSLLESLGLEPALEALAGQLTRTHGVDIALTLKRLPERLSSPIELTLYRAAQQILDYAIESGQAAQISIELTPKADGVSLSLLDDGITSNRLTEPEGTSPYTEIRTRIERLGGRFEAGLGAKGLFCVHIEVEVAAPVELTPREMDVIQLLVEGLSSREIAQRLFISTSTVNYHLENIYGKLGVNSRTEAAIYALRHGWVAR